MRSQGAERLSWYLGNAQVDSFFSRAPTRLFSRLMDFTARYVNRLQRNLPTSGSVMESSSAFLRELTV